MLSVYVLIHTEVGKAGQVAQTIRGIDGVQRADPNREDAHRRVGCNHGRLTSRLRPMRARKRTASPGL
jgi:hypothetical protein